MQYLVHLRSPPAVASFPSHRRGVHTYKATAAVRCMAKPRRVAMVAKQIQRELSDMLLTDKVLQYAILPEVSLGADRYLSSLTTISDVELSTDLQVVKVFVSVFGDERGKEVALAGLKSKARYVRAELGRRMKLRLTPEIRFIEDESLERGSRDAENLWLKLDVKIYVKVENPGVYCLSSRSSSSSQILRGSFPRKLPSLRN